MRTQAELEQILRDECQMYETMTGIRGRFVDGDEWSIVRGSTNKTCIVKLYTYGCGAGLVPTVYEGTLYQCMCYVLRIHKYKKQENKNGGQLC